TIHVTSTVPAFGSTVATAPTTFIVNVSDPVDPLSLDASDFQVNGTAASSVTYVPGTTTIQFGYVVTPVVTQGVETMHIAAGAFLRAGDAAAVSQFDSSFRYDATLLSVVSTTPAAGSVLTIPNTLDLNFNEAFDPSTVQTTDLVLSGTTGISV